MLVPRTAGSRAVGRNQINAMQNLIFKWFPVTKIKKLSLQKKYHKMDQEAIIVRLVGGVITAVVTGAVANYKNRSVFGWAIGGFLLSIIPLLILVFLKKQRTEKEENIQDYID